MSRSANFVSEVLERTLQPAAPAVGMFLKRAAQEERAALPALGLEPRTLPSPQSALIFLKLRRRAFGRSPQESTENPTP